MIFIPSAKGIPDFLAFSSLVKVLLLEGTGPVGAMSIPTFSYLTLS